MPDEEYDAYAGTAGLMDDTDITIKEAEFGFFSDYQDAEVCILKLTVTDEADDAEQDVFLSLGNGWEAKEDGQLAVLEKTGEPNPKGFNRSTRYHKWTAAAVDAGAPLKERGQPYEAGIWPGLRFHVARQAEKNFRTGEDTDVLYPTEYLGEADGDGKAKKATAKKAAPVKKTAGKAAPAEEAGGDEVPKVMLLKLKKLAKECEGDQDAFMERGMAEIDGIENNEAAMALLTDDDWWAENSE